MENSALQVVEMVHKQWSSLVDEVIEWLNLGESRDIAGEIVVDGQK
jgi:hypothetical protein